MSPMMVLAVHTHHQSRPLYVYCSSLRIATEYAYQRVHGWPIRGRGTTVDEDNVASSVEHYITAKLM